MRHPNLGLSPYQNSYVKTRPFECVFAINLSKRHVDVPSFLYLGKHITLHKPNLTSHSLATISGLQFSPYLLAYAKITHDGRVITAQMGTGSSMDTTMPMLPRTYTHI